MQKNRRCPQCKISRFQLKNDAGETLVVTVNQDKTIIPIHENDSLESFDTDVLHCLGCSWKGTANNLLP